MQDYDPLRTINRSHRGWHFTLVLGLSSKTIRRTGITAWYASMNKGHCSWDDLNHTSPVVWHGVSFNYEIPTVARTRSFLMGCYIVHGSFTGTHCGQLNEDVKQRKRMIMANLTVRARNRSVYPIPDCLGHGIICLAWVT